MQITWRRSSPRCIDSISEALAGGKSKITTHIDTDSEGAEEGVMRDFTVLCEPTEEGSLRKSDSAQSGV